MKDRRGKAKKNNKMKSVVTTTIFSLLLQLPKELTSNDFIALLEQHERERNCTFKLKTEVEL
jgi:hypothetical protein